MLTKNNIPVINGANVVVRTLKALGTDKIFGYPGGVVLGIYDELYKQSEIKHILMRHEQSVVHAAEGYARATGKCGVVLVTSGPGATNTVSGITNAYLDGYPLVILAGQVSKSLIGKNAFQEADICDITRSCTKKVFQITDAKDIQSTLIKAFNVALSGKKGPVVVDMAKDIFSQNVEYNEEFIEIKKANTSEKDFKRIINKILKSSYPVIVAGGGVNHSNASEELYTFAKKLGIPVVSTMMGLGTFPQDDRNYFGMIGIFGDKSANQILKQSDLILSIGARFNDRITCMFKEEDLLEKIIQIDINSEEISRNINPIDFIVGDAKQILTEMNKHITKDIFSPWCDYAQGLKDMNTEFKKTTNMLHSFEVIRAIDEYTKDKNIIFTSEVGQHQLFAVKNLTLTPNRKIFVSGGSGTMGFGFPAAIGASFAKSNKEPIICITGDGSFQMSLNELATCKDYDLNLKIMILNNGYLGMVRQLQEKNCNGRYSETKISNPDFVKLANSYGIDAVRVRNLNEVKEALKKAFSTDKTFIIDFVVEPMEVI